MSSIESPSEFKQRCIDAMGEELGKVYYALWNELAWLCNKWGEFVKLFGTDSSRVDLLNNSAPEFFSLVQDSMVEDSLLHVARLTDKPKTLGKENLTIKRLTLLIEQEGLRKHVGGLIDVVDQKAEFCRDWRNRRIAHKDLGLALKEGASLLMPARSDKVREALDGIAEVLNAVSRHFMNSTTCFDGIACRRGADQLVHCLDEGLRAISERRRGLGKRA